MTTFSSCPHIPLMSRKLQGRNACFIVYLAVEKKEVDIKCMVHENPHLTMRFPICLV